MAAQRGIERIDAILVVQLTHDAVRRFARAGHTLRDDKVTSCWDRAKTSLATDMYPPTEHATVDSPNFTVCELRRMDDLSYTRYNFLRDD
jgi:hypothetical protein